MNLPESFRRYGTAVLANTTEVAHKGHTESGCCDLSISASLPSGFDSCFAVEQNTATLYWGSWHTPFEPEAGIDTPVERLFALHRGMLSPDMRVGEL